jgi:N-formylglutamate amidohydrolase
MCLTCPAARGAPFVLTMPDPSQMPVLICAPHGGRAYTPALLAALREGDRAALRLEDRLIDIIATRVAQETGAGLMVARAPRAVLDLNRAPDDVDWGMIPEAERAEALAATLQAGGTVRAQSYPSQRVRAGLGLVPRRVPGLGELWRRPLAGNVLAQRIAGLHVPYHACVSEQLAVLRARWGTALLIDLHSMPPLPCAPGDMPVTCVLGDRFGSSCGTALMAKAFGALDDRVGWWRITAPMPGAMCWIAMLLRVTASMRSNWKSTGRPISIRGWSIWGRAPMAWSSGW